MARKVAELLANTPHLIDNVSEVLEDVPDPGVRKVLELARAVDITGERASLRIPPKRKTSEVDVLAGMQKRKAQARASGRDRVPEHEGSHKMTIQPQASGFWMCTVLALILHQ